MYKDQQILPKLYCTMYVFFQQVVIKLGFFLHLTYITFNLRGVLHYYVFKYLSQALFSPVHVQLRSRKQMQLQKYFHTLL